MIRFRSLLAILAALVLTACANATIPPDASTTIIALRHADRDLEQLNAKGRARAAALPAALSDYKIDAIFSPGMDRNRDTAAPLAKATGLPVTIITTDKVAAQITSRYPKGTVVWVGNKSNLTPLWEDLAAPGPAPLEYGDLFIVRLHPDGRRTVTRRHVAP
ncbi:histidine phosphatase family protein [Shimia sp. FJ5]|uniref:histidine phosphatase family protein n=1 Tax=Shimia sp. FJ5 TaxID=3079054 RepID=UPI002628C486|nr:histidine phosphatase family protein [Shimia sp. FJ5]MDV4145141.1 histidine phosphatase family protein [Shimia sp. FJ5]